MNGNVVTDKATSPDTRPDVSVVMCTYNRAELLDAALKSLLALETDQFDYEVVVVDNNSHDETPQKLSEWQKRFPERLRTVHEPEQGVAYARNRGLDVSRGTWIAYFDDDQTADRGWLVALMRFARERELLFVGGAVHLEFPDGCERQLGRFGRSALIDTRHINKPRRFDYRFTPVTANVLIHRTVFDAVGHFNPQLNARGDDTVLFLRAMQQGFAAWYTPQAIVHHHVAPERFEDTSMMKMVKTEMDGQALLDRQRAGRWFPFLLAGRLIQGIVGYVPRLVVGTMTQNHDLVLEGKLRAIFYLGTFMQGLTLLAPRSVQQRFLQRWVPFPYAIYDQDGYVDNSLDRMTRVGPTTRNHCDVAD